MLERRQTTELSLHDVRGTTAVDGHVRGKKLLEQGVIVRRVEVRKQTQLCSSITT